MFTTIFSQSLIAFARSDHTTFNCTPVRPAAAVTNDTPVIGIVSAVVAIVVVISIIIVIVVTVLWCKSKYVSRVYCKEPELLFVECSQQPQQPWV